MFSGIVEALGTVAEIRPEPPGCWLIVREPKIAGETAVADSISVNGCCLTVVAVDGRHRGVSGRARNARPDQSRRPEAGQPGESGTGAGGRRPAGRPLRQRPHRRHRHAHRAPRRGRLVDVLVLAAPRSSAGRWPRRARSPSTASA